MTSDAQQTGNVLLAEAEATLALVYGFLLIPQVVKPERYLRAISPGVFPEREVDQERDLLSHRQAHRPADVTRLLDVTVERT